jgi:hypothetical protein
MRKNIDQMTHLLERHKINVPDSIKKKVEKSKNPQDDKGKGKEIDHVLVDASSSLSTWVIDLRDSNHKISSQEIFNSLEPCTSLTILMGHNTLVQVCGK